MPARVSTGDRDAVLRQIVRWCAAVLPTRWRRKSFYDFVGFILTDVDSKLCIRLSMLMKLYNACTVIIRAH